MPTCGWIQESSRTGGKLAQSSSFATKSLWVIHCPCVILQDLIIIGLCIVIKLVLKEMTSLNLGAVRNIFLMLLPFSFIFRLLEVGFWNMIH